MLIVIMHLLRVRVHVFFCACVVFSLRVVAALAVHVCVVRLRVQCCMCVRVHCCMCGRVFGGGSQVLSTTATSRHRISGPSRLAA